jgi:Putative transposase
VAESSGFSLHAGIAAKAPQRDKLEHLARYVARPPIATERLSLTEGGLVRLALKTPYRDGTTHVIFEPEDFMARLFALVRPHFRLKGKIQATERRGVGPAPAGWRPRSAVNSSVSTRPNGFAADIRCLIRTIRCRDSLQLDALPAHMLLNPLPHLVVARFLLHECWATDGTVADTYVAGIGGNARPGDRVTELLYSCGGVWT